MNLRNIVMRVDVGPVWVDGAPSRLVQLADGWGRVETWYPMQKRWKPGGATLHEVLLGTPCDDPEAIR